MPVAVKRPAERKGVDYDFRPDLGSLDIALIVSSSSAKRNGGAPLVVGSQAFSEGIVRVEWEGGLDGGDYLTTVVIEDTQGGRHEIDGEFYVRAAGFAVPDIFSTYLSSAEYVARFGVEEAIRLTDETKSRVVDPAKLSAAVEAATAEVESYIRQRYAFPLPSVPAVLRNIVADLAREALHLTRPVPAVTEAATRARKLLADLASGKATLALPGGETPVTQSLAAWGAQSEGAVFNSCTMDGYVPR